MDRVWYLSRAGQIFGPVTDIQLAESAFAGHVLPTDQLNIAGQPNWFSATAVAGLLLAPMPQPLPLLPAPDPTPLATAPSAPEEPIELDAVDELVDEVLVLDTVEVVETVEAPKSRTVRVTCFACFREVSLELALGAASAHCPQCRSAIETIEEPASVPSANQGAFAKLESPAVLKKRKQKKVM